MRGNEGSTPNGGTPNGGRTPDWLVERLHAGELPADEAAKVRARLAEEPGGLARLAALAEDDAATLAALPPADVAREVLRRKETADRIDAEKARQAKKSRGLFLLAPLLLAAGAVALMLARPPATPHDATDPFGEGPEVTRAKGECAEPCLLVFREVAPEKAEKLRDGAEARPADHLQLKYQALGKPYGVVLSIDGRGSVTLHHPANVGDSQALTKTGTATIPRGYTLDDAPKFERFFFVTSEKPLDVEQVLSAARSLARSPDTALNGTLPVDGRQATVTLRKVSP